MINTGESLLPQDPLVSRFDKELDIGLQVRKQILEKQYRGNLRAIAATWIHQYFEYIDRLVEDRDKA